MNWAPIVIAAVPATIALISAGLAARSAKKTKRFEVQAQYVRDLENRIAEKKFETYQPMIDTLYDMLDPEKVKGANMSNVLETFNRFDAWIAIYGSDEVVAAWHRFRQAAFHDAPALVFVRLYADVIMAARRDLGAPNTRVARMEIVGNRLNDLYVDTGDLDIKTILSLDWPEISNRTGWAVPWDESPTAALNRT